MKQHDADKNWTLSADNIVDFIEDIFLRRGSDSYLGEACTMSAHMLQGAQLAKDAGVDDELIAAILLHDIGHYTNEFPEDALEQGQNNYHEQAGAAVLRPFFPARVVDAVQNHVAAKRYLCTVNKDYYHQLSQASKDTLALQGGAMSLEEVEEFESREHYQDAVQIRLWDDIGKAPEKAVAPFSAYRDLLQGLVNKQATHYQS